jgi:hypothetical protein
MNSLYNMPFDNKTVRTLFNHFKLCTKSMFIFVFIWQPMTNCSIDPCVLLIINQTQCFLQIKHSFLGQNEIHSDFMSWQLVRVCIKNSLKIFSETIMPRKLIFTGMCLEVMCLALASLKFVGLVLKFWIFSVQWKTTKTSLIFKNLFLQNRKCYRWTKNSLEI